MHALFTAHTIWTFRRELAYIGISLLILLLLPVIAVIILTQTGINVVSDALIDINPETNTIIIRDPADGTVLAEIDREVVWPVQGVITLEFAQSSGYQRFHTGIDIADPQGHVGTPVTTFMDGTVTYAGEIFWGYGKHIIIDHGDNITSLYAHLNRISVYKGQPVKIGDTIGYRGTTGWSTGPHLHFEIRVFGIPVNPRVVLTDNQ